MVGTGVRCALWVALLLVGQAGCQRRSTPSDHAKAKSSASAHPSASAPVKSSAEPPAVPQEHRISIVAVPRAGSDVRDLVAKVSSPPLEVKLAEIDGSRRCGLLKVTRVERPGLPPSSGRGVMLTCGPEVSIPVIVEGNRLRLGVTTHELGPGPIIHPEEVEGYEAVDCPSWKQKKRPLREIRLERREVVAPDPEAGRAYSLGAIVNDTYREFGRLPKTRMDCWILGTSQGPLLTYLRVPCRFGDRSNSVILKVDEDVVWVEWHDENSIEHEVSKRFGWEVGCQHQYVLRPFSIRDPGYKYVPPGCAELCRENREECLWFPYQNRADDRGVLSPSGEEWAQRCDEEGRKCSARCPVAAP